MKREAPSDREIAEMIAPAFERLPAPASARLKAVEGRLAYALARRETKRRAAGWYWWLIAVLVASGAAAWWSDGYFDREPEPAEQRTEPGAAATEAAPNRGSEPAEPAAPSGGQREIYRRERY